MSVNIYAQDGKAAGTYGYEVTMQIVQDRRLLSPNATSDRTKVTGTFTIPAGKEAVWLTWDSSAKKFTAQAFPK